MNRIFFCILLLSIFLNPLLGCLSVCAQIASNPSELFQKANDLYQEKNYGEAERLYRSAIASGLRSEAVYFNLGNTCFKQGKLGQAILNYQRAHRLAPRNPDIEWNLDFARELRVDKISNESERSFTTRLASSLRDLFRLNELLWITLLLFWILSALMALRLMGRKSEILNSALWTLAILYLAAASLSVLKYNHTTKTTAVIVAPSAEVTSGPDEGSVLFTLHEGTSGIVKREHGDWVRLSLPNGLSGWVEKKNVEYV